MLREYDPTGVIAYAVLLMVTMIGAVLWLRQRRERATALPVAGRAAAAVVLGAAAGYVTSATLTAIVRETFCLYTLFAVATIGGGLAAVFLASRAAPMRRSAYLIVLAIGTAEVLAMPRMLIWPG